MTDLQEESSGFQLRVIVVIGTRPEAIKLFPVILKLQESAYFNPFVINTGQHQDMVLPVLNMVGIVPDLDLGVGREPNTLNMLSTKVIAGVDHAITALRAEDGESEIPNTVAILVHGDTSTAMAAGLAAAQAKLPVAHVEAGLRTDNTLSPFPEELNRQIIARLTSFHFAPTDDNLQNLAHENIPVNRIFVTGNTGIDALQIAALQHAPYSDERLEMLDAHDGPVIVVTAHRRENWGGGLARISEAIAIIAAREPNARIVVSLHPNPLVRAEIVPILEGIDNVLLVEPLDYAEFARLLRTATIAISDSGGIQEEAPSVGTPVLVTREETERAEGVEAGTLQLVGTNTDRIVAAATVLLHDPERYQQMTSRTNPYGDGFASARIVAALASLALGDPPPTPFGSGFSRRAVLEAAGYHELPASALEVELTKVAFVDGGVRYVGPERRGERN